MAFEPFDLGRVFQTAEAIKSMRRSATMDRLQEQYLQGQMSRAGAQEERAQAQESRAAAQENRAATEWSQDQQVVNTRILNAAAAEVAQNPQAAARWERTLKALDPQFSWGDPAAMQQNAKTIFDSTTAALKAFSGSQEQQNNVQSSQILENGNLGLVMRDGTVRDTGQKVRPQMFYGEVGGVPAVTRVTGQDTTTTPLSTIGIEAGAAGQVAGAQAAARTAAETEGARQQKAPALATLEYVADQFTPMLDKTAQGGPLGVIGRAGTVFDYEDATRFDNLREQLSTELRTVFRIPGEGTLSDREQAQYGLQLPNRNYSPAVNAAILQDVRTRASMRVGMDETGAADGGGQWSIRQID